MRILLLNPPFLPKFSRFSRSPAVTRSGTIYYPIWHAYAAGLLEQHGHTVRLVDAPADGLGREDCLRLIDSFLPELSVIYTSTPSIFNDVEIAGEVKDRSVDGLVFLAGPHVSAMPAETLAIDGRIDGVLRGEYDWTLLDLASRHHPRKELGQVLGLTYRDEQSLRATPDRAYCADLDSMPFVSATYKKHLRIDNYFYAHCRYPVVSIFTSRGCYAHCSFCVYPETMFGRRQRQRCPENIVEEFVYIERELPQVKEVLIDDDTFSFREEHTVQVCELMMKRGIRIPWTVECRATLNRSTLKVMKKAGCRLIVIGFESASDVILRNIKKGISHDRMRQFVMDARKAGLLIHSCFMAGNPGETRETLEQSLRFAQWINADTCQFFPLMVYPGTETYRWAAENGYLTTSDFRSWLTPEGLHNAVVSTPDLTAADLIRFCDDARRRYYLRPKYLASKAWHLVKSPEEIGKTLKSTKTFSRHLFRKTVRC